MLGARALAGGGWLKTEDNDLRLVGGGGEEAAAKNTQPTPNQPSSSSLEILTILIVEDELPESMERFHHFINDLAI